MSKKRKAPAEAVEVSVEPAVEAGVAVTAKQTLRLKLLRNEFVNGVFAPQGSVFVFSRLDAEKRLRVTSDTWEVL